MKDKLVVGIVVACFALLSGVLPAASQSLFKRMGSGVATVEILPSNEVEVGHIYFAGQGNQPRFATANGVVFSELCYRDFAKTKALKSIGDFVTTKKQVYKSKTYKTGGNVGVGAGKLLEAFLPAYSPNLTGSTEQSFTVSGLTIQELTAEGIEVVQASIGDNCKAEIAKLRKAKKDVVLVVYAEHAAAGTTSDTGQISGGLGGILGGRNKTESYELEDFYISVRFVKLNIGR